MSKGTEKPDNSRELKVEAKNTTHWILEDMMAEICSVNPAIITPSGNIQCHDCFEYDHMRGDKFCRGRKSLPRMNRDNNNN